MILTVTLNVSVDKAYKIKGAVCPGTVSRVDECRNTAGGKGLNVARIADLCGEDVLAAGFAGGFNGDYVKAMLCEDGIQSRFTKVKGESRSCINILAGDGTSTEFLEPGEPVRPEDVQNFLDQFDEIIRESNVVTISGSIPRGVPSDIYGSLITKIKGAGKQVILDTSGKLLEEGVKSRPTMIKPNDDEIEALLGVPVTNREEIIEGAGKLQKMGIEIVVVSLGSDGALMVTEDGVLQGKPPKIEVVNTVGCGDSMTAAFAVGLSRGYSIEETLRYAVAVSAANAMTMQTGNFRQKDMERILPEVEIKRI